MKTNTTQRAGESVFFTPISIAHRDFPEQRSDIIIEDEQLG